MRRFGHFNEYDIIRYHYCLLLRYRTYYMKLLRGFPLGCFFVLCTYVIRFTIPLFQWSHQITIRQSHIIWYHASFYRLFFCVWQGILPSLPPLFPTSRHTCTAIPPNVATSTCKPYAPPPTRPYLKTFRNLLLRQVLKVELGFSQQQQQQWFPYLEAISVDLSSKGYMCTCS